MIVSLVGGISIEPHERGTVPSKIPSRSARPPFDNGGSGGFLTCSHDVSQRHVVRFRLGYVGAVV